MILSKPNYIKIYGHRGARGDLPENTLESFKYLFKNTNVTNYNIALGSSEGKKKFYIPKNNEPEASLIRKKNSKSSIN